MTKFSKGDVVRSRMTPSIAGQVIGERNWGDAYIIRFINSDEVGEFNAVELELYPVPPQVAAASIRVPNDEDEGGGGPVIIPFPTEKRRAAAGRTYH